MVDLGALAQLLGQGLTGYARGNINRRQLEAQDQWKLRDYQRQQEQDAMQRQVQEANLASMLDALAGRQAERDYTAQERAFTESERARIAQERDQANQRTFVADDAIRAKVNAYYGRAATAPVTTQEYAAYQEWEKAETEKAKIAALLSPRTTTNITPGRLAVGSFENMGRTSYDGAPAFPAPVTFAGPSVTSSTTAPEMSEELLLQLAGATRDPAARQKLLAEASDLRIAKGRDATTLQRTAMTTGDGAVPLSVANRNNAAAGLTEAQTKTEAWKAMKERAETILAPAEIRSRIERNRQMGTKYAADARAAVMRAATAGAAANVAWERLSQANRRMYLDATADGISKLSALWKTDRFGDVVYTGPKGTEAANEARLNGLLKLYGDGEAAGDGGMGAPPSSPVSVPFPGMFPGININVNGAPAMPTPAPRGKENLGKSTDGGVLPTAPQKGAWPSAGKVNIQRFFDGAIRGRKVDGGGKVLLDEARTLYEAGYQKGLRGEKLYTAIMNVLKAKHAL